MEKNIFLENWVLLSPGCLARKVHFVADDPEICRVSESYMFYNSATNDVCLTCSSKCDLLYKSRKLMQGQETPFPHGGDLVPVPGDEGTQPGGDPRGI